MEYTKLNETELQVVITTPVINDTEVTIILDLDSLLIEEENIIGSIATAQLQLDGVRANLVKCAELGIRSKKEVAAELKAAKDAEDLANGIIRPF